jgi:hypothetical protein
VETVRLRCSIREYYAKQRTRGRQKRRTQSKRAGMPPARITARSG